MKKKDNHKENRKESLEKEYKTKKVGKRKGK